jgi:hypothetical protein
MTKLKPLEDFVFEGLSKRVQEVFDSICIITTAQDKTKALEKFLSGKKVEYPYIFITPQTLGPNKESYSTNQMARRGLRTVVGENQMQTVRVLPANFDFEIELITNKFMGPAPYSVMGFARRWMFAARCGYLKFNIQYGSLSLGISLTLADQVTLPSLENKVETETAYKVTATLTVHGYVSEPILGSQGIINELEVDVALAGAQGEDDTVQFFPFN